MRLRTALVVAASLATATEASAAGVLVADPPSSAFVEEIRAAVSVDPSGSTMWVAARIAGAADHVVWIVPRAPGAAVDLATSAWLDALEDATAPRVIAPKTSACEGPAEVVGTGDLPLGVEPPTARRIASAAALSDTEAAWSLVLDPADRVALLSVLADGDELLAVRWAPREGASSTPVLRVRGAKASVPMHLTRAEAQPIDVTVSLIADSRATAPFTSLVAIADADLSWPGGAASYAGARDALLGSGTAARFVVESSSPAALTVGEWVAGAGKAPSAADAFLRRAVLRGELAGDGGQVTAARSPALTGEATFSAPCARGDLASGAACADGASLGEGTLGRADDLAFALAGTPRERWVTRLFGRIPAGGRGKSLSLAPSDGPGMSVLRRAGRSTCAVGSQPGGGGGDAPSGSGGVSAGSGQVGPDEPADEPEASSSSSQTTVDVNVGCQTDGSESCSSDSSSGDGCSGDSADGESGCSGDSADGEDGCSGDSADGGDGCSGSDGGDGGSSCDGGGDGSSSGGGCSGGDGSSSGGCSGGGGGGGDCAVSRGKRRRPSKWAFFALALAFPLRRWSRARRET